MAHALAQQGGRGQDGEQKAHAFERAGGQQPLHLLRHGTQTAGQRQQQQAHLHHAARAKAVGAQAHQQAQRHAGELHHGEQKTRLHQAHAQRFVQHRNRHRQLADVQRRTHPHAQHHPGHALRQRAGVVFKRQGPHGNNTVPQRRSCSRMAKRSVMPAM